RIEGEELLHQREGDAFFCRRVQPPELQRDIGVFAVALEDAVLLLEVEQRPGGDRDDDLAFEGNGHVSLSRAAAFPGLRPASACRCDSPARGRSAGARAPHTPPRSPPLRPPLRALGCAPARSGSARSWRTAAAGAWRART